MCTRINFFMIHLFQLIQYTEAHGSMVIRYIHMDDKDFTGFSWNLMCFYFYFTHKNTYLAMTFTVTICCWIPLHWNPGVYKAESVRKQPIYPWLFLEHNTHCMTKCRMNASHHTLEQCFPNTEIPWIKKKREKEKKVDLQADNASQRNTLNSLYIGYFQKVWETYNF